MSDVMTPGNGSSVRPTGWPNAVLWIPELQAGTVSFVSPEPEAEFGAWLKEVDGPNGAHRARLFELAHEVAGDGRPRRYENEVVFGGERRWVRTELQRVSLG